MGEYLTDEQRVRLRKDMKDARKFPNDREAKETVVRISRRFDSTDKDYCKTTKD